MEKMQQSDSSRLLVIDQDRLVGILTLKDLLDFMRTRLQAPRGGRSSNPQDRARSAKVRCPLNAAIRAVPRTNQPVSGYRPT
jgi:CBS-domain-containing membrane protein